MPVQAAKAKGIPVSTVQSGCKSACAPPFFFRHPDQRRQIVAEASLYLARTALLPGATSSPRCIRPERRLAHPVQAVFDRRSGPRTGTSRRSQVFHGRGPHPGVCVPPRAGAMTCAPHTTRLGFQNQGRSTAIWARSTVRLTSSMICWTQQGVKKWDIPLVSATAA